ncbi:MAG: hypothetical protein IK132_05260 [Clostridia bacterium]|nr:hypothetical protein [Clostridia bacterium]
MDKNYGCDVALLSVTATEYAAVRHFHEWEEFRTPGDEQAYERTVFTRDGREYRLLHARCAEMGMTAAAALTMKLICTFRPHYLIMVGIAAGVALTEVAEQIYGDVIVPDVVWNYAVGKFVSPEAAFITYGDVGFLPRSTSVAVPEEILSCVREAAASPENQCHVLVGPMACGSTVVANRKVLDKQVYSQFKGTMGLDMESYAVVYAALHAPEPRPLPLVVKSVCDYANSEKSDQYQKFAAYTSCEFAKLLYEKYLPL